MKLKNIKICIDFDGTIVDDFDYAHRCEKPGAFATMKKLQEAGAYLVLWTLREGKYLAEALEYCVSNGLVFNSVNEIPIEIDYRRDKKSLRRKPDAHYFIDDRNIGGFIGWDRIETILLGDNCG